MYWPYKLAKHKLVTSVIVPGEPVSKHRARFGNNGRVYSPQASKEAQEWVAWHIKQKNPYLLPDSTGLFGIRIIFYRSNNIRLDIDNLSKLVLDAITNLIWKDDRQLKELFARKEICSTKDEARTEIVIYTCGGLSPGIGICAICKKQFNIYPASIKRKYCSIKCASLAQMNPLIKCQQCGKEMSNKHPESKQHFCSKKCRELATTNLIVCQQCGKEFRRPKSLDIAVNKFCSLFCYSIYAQKETIKRPRGSCIICGKPVSRKEYQHCRSCMLKLRATKES